jgi:hypothetical protein
MLLRSEFSGEAHLSQFWEIAMSSGQYLFWLAEQSLLIYALPFNIALLAIIILFARASYPLPKHPHLLSLLGLVQFLIPITIVLFGLLFVTPSTATPQPTNWLVGSVELLVPLLFYIQIPIGGYIILRVDQGRFLIASLTAIQIFVSFTSMLVSSMSIAGDWI